MTRPAARDVRRHAAHLIRTRARSFYVASLFLPAALRHDFHIMYAYYRTIDDLVDDPPAGWDRNDIRAELSRIESALDGDEQPDPMMQAALEVARRHRVPHVYLHMVLDGVRVDLDMRAFETRRELLHYSVLVAGSVGMVMAHILGARDEKSLAAACDLGVAMQLTNVLRDVGEDLQRGRVYLPRADLIEAGCFPDLLSAGTDGTGPDRAASGLHAAMANLVQEARRLYEHGVEGIDSVEPSARFAISLASTLYRRILDKIERNDYDVFTERIHLGTVEKWSLVVPVYLRHRGLSLRA